MDGWKKGREGEMKDGRYTKNKERRDRKVMGMQRIRSGGSERGRGPGMWAEVTQGLR